MEILKDRKMIIVISLIILRIGLSIVQILRDFKMLNVQINLNFMDISNDLNFLVIIAIIYVAISHYLKGEEV